ncbi:unnamed protein product, partial [Owenia fusiformis]
MSANDYKNQTHVISHLEVGNESITSGYMDDLKGGKSSMNDMNEALDSFSIFMLTSNCVLSLMICGGNIPVVVSIISFKSLRTVSNMFLVSLAVADILI